MLIHHLTKDNKLWRSNGTKESVFGLPGIINYGNIWGKIMVDNEYLVRFVCNFEIRFVQLSPNKIRK